MQHRSKLIAAALCLAGGIAAQTNLDYSFDPQAGADGLVIDMLLQPDGKVLLGGSFNTYNGGSSARLARVNADGSPDATFNVAPGMQYWLSELALQPDGKILVGGGFNFYDGAVFNHIGRLNPDGSRDTTFVTGTGTDYPVFGLAVQPDGKILIGGNFNFYNGTPAKGLARLLPDGSLDPTFDVGAGPNETPQHIVVQPDGKILIAGSFTSYNGVPRNYVARVNADGSLDTSFDPGVGAEYDVHRLALQPDGKVIIVGFFDAYGGAPRDHVARVNADGSLDTGFDPGAGANGVVYSVAVQTDLRVLITGQFTAYDGVARNHLARLEADGSLDMSFDPGTGTDQQVNDVITQPNGRILICGDFTTYDGVSRMRVARLHKDVTTTAIGEHQGMALSAQPNPACDVVYVHGLAGAGTWRLLDAQGRHYQSGQHTAGALRLDVSALAQGPYLLQVQEATGNRTLRIDKQ